MSGKGVEVERGDVLCMYAVGVARPILNGVQRIRGGLSDFLCKSFFLIFLFISLKRIP